WSLGCIFHSVTGDSTPLSFWRRVSLLIGISMGAYLVVTDHLVAAARPRRMQYRLAQGRNMTGCSTFRTFNRSCELRFPSRLEIVTGVTQIRCCNTSPIHVADDKTPPRWAVFRVNTLPFCNVPVRRTAFAGDDGKTR
ncbi:unnamed protein product, partial [Ectocarpus sp. 6 AP-2014]